VILTVTDNTGAVDTVSQIVNVAAATNQAPLAAFTFACTDLACNFDGTNSSDPDGSIVSYAWDFGDGATASGMTATHTYAAAGTYSVTLTVTDDLGATGSANQSVTVTAPATTPGTGRGPGRGR
jgi:PKD repeat protein